MRYSIDRFEGETAVLVSEQDELHIPLHALPEGVRPGDLLERPDDGGWQRLAAETLDRRKALAERRKRLLGGTS